MSVNYIEINKRAVDLLLSVKKHVPSIDRSLQALVEIRVSQINGCAYCVDLHTAEARHLGVHQQILDCLPVWRESQLFYETEMIALDWAESVTQISTEQNIKGKLEILLKHFSENEAVDLTVVISLMNSLNRLAISFGDKPSRRNAYKKGETVMDDVNDFLKRYRQRLLRHLDAKGKISPDEPDPLQFVDEVLDAWSKFSQNRKLAEPSDKERTFWFSLYQLEDLVENPVGGQLDPYEGILMQNLAMAREALKQWKKLPEGLFATRPGE